MTTFAGTLAGWHTHVPTRAGLRQIAGLTILASLVVACSASPGGSPGATMSTVAATSGANPTASPAVSTSGLPAIPRSELTGRIAFERAGGAFGDGTVFTANADGSNERQLAATCCPRWSWDGKRILAAALDNDGRRITTQILDPNGTLVSKVPLPSGTLNLGPGTWAPDGKRICFDGFGDAKDEGLYVGNVAGGGLIRLTHKRGQTVDFTPDGKRVIYFEGDPAWVSDNPDEPDGRLYVINADGSGSPTLITPKDLKIGNLGGSIARLSRDGEWLVFGAIWKIHVDGSGLTKVFEPAGEGVALTPTWSPDGRYIMFALDPPGTFSADDPANTLVVIRADGSGLGKVTTTPDFKVGPDWAASGA